MLSIFKPAAHIARVPVDKVDPLYRRLRWQIFMGIFFGYAAYYLVRKNFTLAMPYLIEEGFSRGDLGFALSGISIAYGFSKFIMLIETLWLLPVAAVYLFFIADSATSHLGANPWSLNLLLVAAGIVTTVPLLFFTAAATRLRLSTLGFFQYLGPTLMFLLAITFYGETVGQDKLVTFGFIWAALVLFTLDALYTQRKLR